MGLLFMGRAECFAYEKIDVLVFVSKTCKDCRVIKSATMRNLDKNILKRINVEFLDISNKEYYELLISLEDEFNSKGGNLPTVFMEGKFFYGKKEILSNGIVFLKKVVEIKEVEKIPPFVQISKKISVMNKFNGVSPLVIIGAGLIDGINPCAFSTMVFLVAILSCSGYDKKQMIKLSLSFIGGLFTCYFLLGVGIFGAFRAMPAFWKLNSYFTYAIAGFAFVVGVVSFYDGVVYNIKKDASAVKLQLPNRIKESIHAVIRRLRFPENERNFNKAGLKYCTVAFLAGSGVSLLESICTGQIYLPTIGFLINESSLKMRALSFLFLYNVAFIIPLAGIFVAAVYGVKSQWFSEVIKNNLTGVKFITSGIAFLLGVLVLVVK